jgi:hypothetical protein
VAVPFRGAGFVCALTNWTDKESRLLSKITRRTLFKPLPPISMSRSRRITAEPVAIHGLLTTGHRAPAVQLKIKKDGPNRGPVWPPAA